MLATFIARSAERPCGSSSLRTEPEARNGRMKDRRLRVACFLEHVDDFLAVGNAVGDIGADLHDPG